MDADTADRYLARFGADRSMSLAELQARHLQQVPFENLSIHLADPIDLDAAALVGKVVDQRRGGFCYELNGLFAALLEALGGSVDLVSAQVFGADGTLGPPLDHLTLLVSWPSSHGRWLVDVGFGRFSTHPLRWDDREEQFDPGGRFRLVDAEHGCVDVMVGGRPQLRVDPRPLRLEDFGPMCWWQQYSPTSHFAQGSMCSRLLPDGGRVTLAGRQLIRTSAGGERSETDITDDAELLAAYRTEFGITIDRLPVPPN